MISYGYQPKGDNDAVVSTTLEVMRFIEKVITPNLYLVDSIPLRKIFLVLHELLNRPTTLS